MFNRLRDLWMKVNKRYVIFFDPSLESELEKALPSLFSGGVFSYQVMTSDRQIVGSDDGQMAILKETGVQYTTQGNPMPYNEFLQRINRSTSIPITSLHKAMCEAVKEKPTFHQDMINDQSLVRVITNINNWKI